MKCRPRQRILAKNREQHYLQIQGHFSIFPFSDYFSLLFSEIVSQKNQLTNKASKHNIHTLVCHLSEALLQMYRKCHACKKPHPEVGKVSPESHRSAPYFPQHTNFSSTCDSNNDRNHCFHFLSNWRRNGARDKKQRGAISQTDVTGFAGGIEARQRLRFVQFGKFAATPKKKLQNPQMQSCLSFSDLLLLLVLVHTTAHLYLRLFSCPLGHNYPSTFAQI